jgi:hypothetical protein
MDTTHIDSLLHSLKSALSRRGVLAALGGILATLPFSLDDSADARKGKRRKRRKNRKKRKNRKPETRADATCPGPADDLIPTATNGEARFAQTFTAGRRGVLVRAELVVLSDATTAADLILRLAPLDDEGVPTNTILAEAAIAGAAAPVDLEAVSFSFVEPASVEAGVSYALVLTRPGGDDFGWAVEENGGCPGGRFGSDDQTAPFELLSSGAGFVFTTFVRS